MITSLKFALYLTCFCLWRVAPTTTLKLSLAVRQESGFRSVNVGDSVTLRCFYEGDVAAMFYWYKQTLGQKPTMISNFYKHDKNGTFIDDLKNDPRFKLETKNGNNHLTISDLRVSDSATYYCIGGYTYKFEFAEGTTVEVKGSGFPVLVHQSASETIKPGGSVTLNCTVHTGTCDGEHSVYWFKNSEKSYPGLIYTHGGRNDQCERNTQTCVYNLPMESLNQSHAGTYYCAVVSCGHILFGNETKLDFEDDVDSPDSLVYFLSGALVFTTMLIILLTFSMYKMNRRNCQCTECPRVSASTTTNTQDHQVADNLHYAALQDLRANRSRKQRDNTDSECVYSGVKQ
ncbi:uncharacterized protein LOC131989614 [Centropristis striata]|uniref:uncharacterized protein LOC131989614 n=1 Tax=Centropristis striata TaxID=184440 RepID=UPI0027E102C5|nr:uncharacterized protein LOC131989614 [Centropristis striata]